MSEQSETKSKPWYFQPRNIAIIFIAVVFLILILQNMESVLVQILFWKATAPAALIYIIFALVGFGAAKLTIRRKPKEPQSKKP